MSRFYERWKVTINVVAALAVFISCVTFLFVRQETQIDRNKEFVTALVEERIISAVADCHQGNEFRTSFPDTLRHVVELSEAAGGGPDLTSFPAFVAITDPSTKDYLRELERRLNAAPEDEQPNVVIQAAEDYERDFPVIDCKQFEKELRRDLRPG